MCTDSLFYVLDEKFSAEVESWMTGEQFADCLLSARYCQRIKDLGMCKRLSQVFGFRSVGAAGWNFIWSDVE